MERIKLTVEEFVQNTAQIEKNYFYGEISPITTKIIFPYVVKGTYKLIDGVLYKVYE
jgi:hypothetical protein